MWDVLPNSTHFLPPQIDQKSHLKLVLNVIFASLVENPNISHLSKRFKGDRAIGRYNTISIDKILTSVIASLVLQGVAIH